MENPTSPNAATGESAAPADAEGVTQLKAEIEKMQKQFQGQSAALRKAIEAQEKLAAQLSQMTTTEQKPEEKPKGPIATKLAELDALKAQIAERDRQAEEKLHRSRMRGLRETVQRQLAESGADANLAKLATEALVARLTGKVVFDDSTGEEVAAVQNGEDVVPLSDFLTGYMATEEGKALIPSRTTPNLSGLIKGPAGVSGKVKITSADLRSGRFSLDDVMTGKVVLVDAG